MPFGYQLSTLLYVYCCTYIPSLSVLPGRSYRFTGLISDLAVILILSSYSPLCVFLTYFPVLAYVPTLS